MHELPIIDVAPLLKRSERRATAESIRSACVDKGFFYIEGHGVDPALEERLELLSQAFFALPIEEKMKISMDRAGRAWRGFFPLGGELTSGQPDWKEGLYFGDEHPADHPLVRAQIPLHGSNLYPAIPDFGKTVAAYMEAITRLSHHLMQGIALSLGLPETYFQTHFTRDPTLLFRIFHYPPPPKEQEVWGVGEHSDYGLLTILKQDSVGGLEVKSGGGWVQAPPIRGTFVCNIGDMLDRLTKGLYRSTPHRVRNRTERERYSYPFFFDPGFDAKIEALPIDAGLFSGLVRPPSEERWDRADVHAFEGTYGEYPLRKVGKVFPDLDSR